MKRTSALGLRQSLGKVLAQLKRGGEPIIIEQRGQAAAVLISLTDYKKRFVDTDADEERRRVAERIKNARLMSPQPVLDTIASGRR